MAPILTSVHDYIAFSFIRETNPAHWQDSTKEKLTREYVKPTTTTSEDELHVVGRDGTGIKYELFSTSDLSYHILSNTEESSIYEIVLIKGNVGGVSPLPAGKTIQ